MEFKGTKGTFKDGTKGWKVDNRETNGVKGFEVHWSDDGECVTDHVYTIEDAKLIAAAPELLEACQKAMNIVDLWHSEYSGSDDEGDEFFGERQATLAMKEKIESAINKALK